jgi:hypothetical protein
MLTGNLVQLVVFLLIVAFVVPRATNNGVSTVGDWIYGLLAVLAVWIGYRLCWSVFGQLLWQSVAPRGYYAMAGSYQFATVFSWLVEILSLGVAIFAVGKFLPRLLYVRDFKAAFVAALVIGVAQYLVHFL